MNPLAPLLIAGAILLLGAVGVWASDLSREDRTDAVANVAGESQRWPADVRVALNDAQKIEARASGSFAHPVESLLAVDGRLRHGEFVWNDRDIPQGPIWIRVDKKSQIISVFRAGHEIGTAVILYGAETNETPKGKFPILAKIEDHHSSTYDAPMPYTLRLTGDGVAIHGSDVKWGRATHGCVGVPLEFARKLFEQARKGDEVSII